MKIVAAKCPNCGANIEVDKNSDQTKCEFCNSTIIVDDAIQKYKIEISGEVKVKGIQTLEEENEIVTKHIKVDELGNALTRIEKILSKDPFDEDALYNLLVVNNKLIKQRLAVLRTTPNSEDKYNKTSYYGINSKILSRIQKMDKSQRLSEELNEYLKNYAEFRGEYDNRLFKYKMIVASPVIFAILFGIIVIVVGSITHWGFP